MRRPTPYTLSARLYDVISFEWPVYGAGREAAFELLICLQEAMFWTSGVARV